MRPLPGREGKDERNLKSLRTEYGHRSKICDHFWARG